MNFNIQALEEKLNNINLKSKEIDRTQHYNMMNERYKRFISNYSLEYLEMSDWYYGPDLPYHIYCNHFQKKNDLDIDLKGTYFESKKDMIELYKLFIFYGFFEYCIKNSMIL